MRRAQAVEELSGGHRPLRLRMSRIHAPALTYFDEVQRSHSIREAARRLNVASSAVNRQILQLEAEIGAQLFERASGGLKLTAAGRIFADHVANVIEDLERANGDLDALSRARDEGHVSLVAMHGLCQGLIPEAVEEIESSGRYSIGVSILEAHEITKALIVGHADLGLAFESDHCAAVQRIASARLKMGILVRADSPLLKLPAVDLADCRPSRIIIRKGHFPSRTRLLAILDEIGFSHPRLEADSLEVMKQLVLRGLGIAFTANLGLGDDIENDRLKHIPLKHGGQELYGELGLYTQKQRVLPAAGQTFAHCLIRMIENISSREAQ